MQHHADFAIPIHQKVHLETNFDPDGKGPLVGLAIALGWWVDPDAEANPNHEPTGTLYLLVDPKRPRPYWVAQEDLVDTRVLE